MGLRPIQLQLALFVKDSDGQVSDVEQERSIRALRWAMGGVVQANVEWLLTYPNTPSLYESDVLYKLEKNTEIWQDIPTTLERGYGDCEDLAMWRCAELRVQGVDACPYISGRRSANGRRTIFHATVEWPNGMIEDPSRALGMHGHPITRSPIFIA